MSTSHPSRGRLAPLAADDVPNEGLERSIAAIWTAVLANKAIPRSVNFLDVGGDSLSAALVLARIKRQFGVTITVREFLSTATVSSLAELVASRLPGAA